LIHTMKISTALLTFGFLLVVVHAGPCYVNVSETHQLIDGFGFSSAWSGKLSAVKNSALYETLGMSLLRIRIDENGNWSDETANAAAAHSAGVKVLGSPWSGPPAWNTNGKSGGGHLITSHYGDYANWLLKAANSHNLDFVSIQNEPDFFFSDWTNWTPEEIFNFMKNFVTIIGKPIVMPESFHFNDAYSDPVINDAEAVNHFTYLGGHLYGGGTIVHQNALNHHKRIWMTEYYIDHTQTSMPNCMNIAKSISDCMNVQMSAYIWWWVNDGDTSVNLVNNQGTIFKNGYTIGQFAKWIRPGYVRCSTTYNPSTNIYVTAYRNGESIVIVAINMGNTVNQQFTLGGGSSVRSLNVHRTSANENMATVGSVSVDNNGFSYSLPGQSVTTFHP